MSEVTRGGETGAGPGRPVVLKPRPKADPREGAAGGCETSLGRFAEFGFERLRSQDAELHDLLEREHQRQSRVLSMVAASSTADPSVIACTGTVTLNVTTEGYPGARLHAGCQVVDDIERLAIERAKAAFGARYANVQPHSGTSANMIVLFGLLKAGDTLLGLDVESGGNFTHGSPASVSGQHFRAIPYGLNSQGWIDYDQARALACEHRPKLIVCGASSHPRAIDFARFREIADEVGAYLLADISHIAGLVAAGEHASPVDHAHFTTTSTYKQLYGPRGGLILIGRDVDTTAPDGETRLPEMIQQAVFPYLQGTPILSAIAAKARALAMVDTSEFRELAGRVVADARALASALIEKDYDVLTGGTDNHTVLIDVGARGLTGLIAERALEECDIVINRCEITGSPGASSVHSDVRLGTNTLALRGMGPQEMKICADLVHRVLSETRMLAGHGYTLDSGVRAQVSQEVARLCERFPIPHYPTA